MWLSDNYHNVQSESYSITDLRGKFSLNGFLEKFVAEYADSQLVKYNYSYNTFNLE
jgi:hypothetical protein